MAVCNKFQKLVNAYYDVEELKEGYCKCQKCYTILELERSSITENDYIVKCKSCCDSIICFDCFESEYKEIVSRVSDSEVKKIIRDNMKSNYKCRMCIYIQVEDSLFPRKICNGFDIFKIRLIVNTFMYLAIFEPENLYDNSLCCHVKQILKKKSDYTNLDFLEHKNINKILNDECVVCNLCYAIFSGYYNSYSSENKKSGLEHYASMLDEIITLKLKTLES
jgi:hypothetical protein